MPQQDPSSRTLARVAGGVLTLLCVASLFFLSREQSTPAPAPTSPPVTQGSPSPASTSQVGVNAAERSGSLEERLDALDKKVDEVRQRTGEATPTAAPTAQPTSSAQQAALTEPPDQAIASYLQQVDSIVGASAMVGPLPIAAKLLERGMAADPSQSDALIEKTNQAKAELAALTPPEGCQEHHRLLLGQLSEAVVLLREVKVADANGDTTRLAALAESSLKSQEEAAKLSALDRDLRSRVSAK